MIKRILLTVTLAMAGVAQATIFTYNFDGAANNGGTILDGNATGLRSTIGVSITPSGDTVDQLVGVRVLLNISGGFNGDLYGYLVSPAGTRVDLMNNLGYDGSHPLGNTSSGINVILDASAGSNIQDVHEGSVSGTKSAAGDLTSFATGNPAATGTWTLFLADMSKGGGNETLTSWGLELSVVPEPTTWALIIFGAGVAGQVVVRRFRHQPA